MRPVRVEVGFHFAGVLAGGDVEFPATGSAHRVAVE
jgi:hypothetical protein